jgi:phosphoenolpyruvate carboxylase
MRLGGRDLTIAEWIGSFHPDRIRVIPLFEDREGMQQADQIVRRFFQDKTIDYQRVFLARSDPAVNYGQVGAVLLNKIALYNFHLLAEETGIPVYPIIGAGSAPFRGNLRPDTVRRVCEEYAGAYTFTIQSAFKYDHHQHDVAEAVRYLENREIEPARPIDSVASGELIDRYSAEYRRQLIGLAPVINRISSLIPSRRKRKLHVGLFGYSRSMDGISLPRAITLTAALYSLGIPPEILGLNALTERDRDLLGDQYRYFAEDLADATRFLDLKSPYLPPEVAQVLPDWVEYAPDEEHVEITRQVQRHLSVCENGSLQDLILRAGTIRRFLG